MPIATAKLLRNILKFTVQAYIFLLQSEHVEDQKGVQFLEDRQNIYLS